MIYRVSLPIIFTDYYLPWGPNLKADYRKNIYNFWNFSCNSTTSVQFSSVQLLSHDPTGCCTPGFLVHHQLPELAQTHVHCVSDAIQPSHPLSSPFCLQSFPASRSFPTNQFFESGGQKNWRFSFNISPSTEYSGLISFRIDLLAVQRGLSRVFSRTTVQEHQFFTTQFSLRSTT